MIQINGRYYLKSTIMMLSEVMIKNYLNLGKYFFIVKINLGNNEIIEEFIYSKGLDISVINKIRDEIIEELNK